MTKAKVIWSGHSQADGLTKEFPMESSDWAWLSDVVGPIDADFEEGAMQRLEAGNRPELVATATDRSKLFLAAKAIRENAKNDERQMQEIRCALKEADAGDFASVQQVAAVARK